ncbi:hypothetical protein CVS30_07020 [Arthrobacter psychrolactophilus]|uniref:DUF624 domain-containing protein n=2 Tax=Arthrobacter psychrolactophilus TaxID=92442 RepID=A0A2V5JM52_9MICC|nr:hypothetical protein CVS30_07020 [Arthrobacter psychrolactophilus]
MNASWALKAYTLFDTLLWIACLNLLWLVFTLGGLVIFGVGPSTVAAHELIRCRVRGDAVPLMPAFWGAYRRNFRRGNVLGVVAIFVAAMLFANWKFFSVEPTFLAQLAAGVIVLLSIIFVATLCYLFPMYARYQLPVLRYFTQSSRFALRNLAGTVLLLLVTAAVGIVSLRLPGLVPFFSVGVWMFLVGWLCDKFYSSNDESMADVSVGATLEKRGPRALATVRKSQVKVANLG